MKNNFIKKCCRPIAAIISKFGFFLLFATLFIQGCGGSSPPAPTSLAAPAVPEPAATTESFSKLKAEGTIWMNAQGEKVSLRGINLGNWLAMELWMFDSGDNPLGEEIVDQCTLEAKLEERFGSAEKDRLIKLHRDTWVTEADFDVMANAGFNVIRVPFLYNLIENEDAPMTLTDDAWNYLDWAIAEAKEREMYVILDLHGAVGRQGVEQHTGCEGVNELWNNVEYQERTVWLWEEIAKKYKDESAVAAYGLLNEPWGTTSDKLKTLVIEMYNAIRAVDEEHIILLPGHNADGIAFYGDPLDDGMQNVAFEMHFYPGLFGWGEIGYAVHRDWLTCGENGDAGVCSWAKQARDVFTPVLIGEMQPWNGLGDLGGEITRATFDKYNQLNWAGTAWSYKVTTSSGGQGNGRWGLVTNNGNQLLAKAQTWSCPGWENTFADACDVPAISTTPFEGEGTKTMYLVIKTGGFGGRIDVVYDSIALIKDSNGENLVVNGEFGAGSQASWTELSLWPDPRAYNFDYAAGEFAGGDTGAAFNVTSANSHGLIYQAVEVEGGESYTLSGKFIDQGSLDTWAEIYLVPDEPQEFVDVTGRAIPSVDVNTSSIDDIENYLSFFGVNEMDYVVHDEVVNSLTRMEPATIFTNIPGNATNLALNVGETSVDMSWSPATGQVDGYKIYRSTAPRSGFEVIGESISTRFVDESLSPQTTYYYYVAAFNEVDEGYASNIEASGDTFYTVPTRIEAENYTAAHPGVNTEASGDVGGGFNTGTMEPGRWLDYEISVPTAGEYLIEFRLATQVDNRQFEVRIGSDVLTTITVPNTMGWQIYETEGATINLPAGRSTLRLQSVNDQWNLNWLEISDMP